MQFQRGLLKISRYEESLRSLLPFKLQSFLLSFSILIPAVVKAGMATGLHFPSVGIQVLVCLVYLFGTSSTIRTD